MSLRPPTQTGAENPTTAAADEGSLSSVAVAMVRDHDRTQQAKEALQDADDLPVWAARFSLLGDENRLRILLSVHRAPGITVSGLASAVGMSDNATSQALAALRVAGVVEATRDGRFRRWSIADQEVHSLLHRVGGSDPGRGRNQDEAQSPGG